MDSAQRDRAGVLKQIVDAGPRGRFFPTIALLERLFPSSPALGTDGPPRLEPIRFRHDPSLRFSAGDMSGIRFIALPATDQGPARHIIEVVTTFLGLTGSISPLPNFVADAVQAEDPEHPIRRDFLDVFHHRAISLLFRGVSRLSIPRAHESHATSTWIKRSLCLAGIDSYEAPATRALPLAQLLPMLPLLVGRARGARTLRTALRQVVGTLLERDIAIEIVENVEGWVHLAADQRTALGRANGRLGIDANLGVRARERSGRFVVRVGPLTQGDYDRFDPGGDALALIQDTVQIFTRNAVDYDLELVLNAETATAFRLGAGVLGRTAWLGGRTAARSVTRRDAHRTAA